MKGEFGVETGRSRRQCGCNREQREGSSKWTFSFCQPPAIAADICLEQPGAIDSEHLPGKCELRPQKPLKEQNHKNLYILAVCIKFSGSICTQNKTMMKEHNVCVCVCVWERESVCVCVCGGGGVFNKWTQVSNHREWMNRWVNYWVTELMHSWMNQSINEGSRVW